MTDEGMRGNPMDAVEAAHALANAAQSAFELYVAFKAQGFSESQAFDLVRAWLHGSAGGKL